MDAIEAGARQGRSLNPVLFEKLTREEYRNLGQLKARQLYKREAKQKEFVQGWMAAMQQFFKLMADGPRRRVTVVRITIECDKCGFEERLKISSEDDVTEYVRHFKNKPCPECQKADRHIDDEFDTHDFERE